MFREDLQKYHIKEDGTFIRPIDIPPLVPVNFLPPTAKNKMRHVSVDTKNLKCAWKETAAKVSRDESVMANNLKRLETLIASSKSLGKVAFSGADGDEEFLIHIANSTDDVKKFLTDYTWSEKGVI
jgi:hypothetical protein